MSPSLPPPSTRDRILTYLAENPLASAQALSRAWGLTRADIRYHLNALTLDGLIELAPRPSEKPAGRGRPIQYYRLKAASASHHLDSLCAALLNTLFNMVGPDQQDQALSQVADQLAAGHQLSSSPIQRLNDAVHFLNQRGYRARWEASASGPRFLLRGCPYAVLLKEHPEICQVDRRFLEVLTGLNLRQEARANPLTGKPPACVFSPQWISLVNPQP